MATLRGDPNFIFIDIDSTTDHKVIEKILNSNSKFKRIGGYPTVLFTGNGFHIYQPISQAYVWMISVSSANYCQEPSRQFLRFAENYLSNGKSDPNHNPSFASCLVRIPGSINSKNGKEVQVLQEWDGKRPHIALMLGSFMTWLLKNEIVERSKFAKLVLISKIDSSQNRPGQINWIEVLLKTPLEDYRKTIVNLVLAPYLVNIRQLKYEIAFKIIKNWLELCTAHRKLDFIADSLTDNALSTARKSGYKPMKLDTLKARFCQS